VPRGTYSLNMENPDFLYPVLGSPGAAAAGAACVFLAVCALLTMAGCGGPYSPRREPATVPAPPPEHRVADTEPTRTGVNHVVERGQTLWRIARAYGVDPEELARLNGIDDPTRIETGQVLFIPGATAVLDVPPYVPPVAPDLSGAGDPRGTEEPDGSWLWPVSRPRLLSGFGVPRRSRPHQGIDVRGDTGDPTVVASRAGRVAYSGSGMSGYGKTVILDHGDGISSLYAHNSRLLVREGESVKRGQAIARVGRTGNATAVHCHFEIREHGRPVDPLSYLEPDREARR